MSTINNVNVGVIEQVVQEARADKARARRTQKLQGEWLLQEPGPQFKAEVSYEGGKIIMETDQAKNLGGGGARPGPLHYCFLGMLSCYTASYATVASLMGIKLRKLTARLESDLNFSRIYGISKEPIMEEIRIVLEAESDAPASKLKEAEKIAHERCPAVLALTQGVRLKTSLEIK